MKWAKCAGGEFCRYEKRNDQRMTLKTQHTRCGDRGQHVLGEEVGQKRRMDQLRGARLSRMKTVRSTRSTRGSYECHVVDRVTLTCGKPSMVERALRQRHSDDEKGTHATNARQ